MYYVSTQVPLLQQRTMGELMLDKSLIKKCQISSHIQKIPMRGNGINIKVYQGGAMVTNDWWVFNWMIKAWKKIITMMKINKKLIKINITKNQLRYFGWNFNWKFIDYCTWSLWIWWNKNLQALIYKTTEKCRYTIFLNSAKWFNIPFSVKRGSLSQPMVCTVQVFMVRCVGTIKS